MSYFLVNFILSFSLVLKWLLIIPRIIEFPADAFMVGRFITDREVSFRSVESFSLTEPSRELSLADTIFFLYIFQKFLYFLSKIREFLLFFKIYFFFLRLFFSFFFFEIRGENNWKVRIFLRSSSEGRLRLDNTNTWELIQLFYFTTKTVRIFLCIFFYLVRTFFHCRISG